LRLYVRTLAVASIAALAACSGGATNQNIPAGPAAGPAQVGISRLSVNQVPNTRALCDYAPPAGMARCFALVSTQFAGKKGVQPNINGYGAPDLIAAYNLPHGLKSGKGQKVGIVDAFDDPNAESDLAVYRAQYGLPACTTANKCFKKVNQQGQPSPLPRGDSGWAGEISLDLDMVSAICPHCKIILVEATSNSFSDLQTADDEAVTLKANVVSNSYGGGEGGATNVHYDHPGHIITASSGDSGYGAQQPCSYSTVVCVGGTTLARSSGGRGWTEQSWHFAGSGCSAVVTKPSWQTDSGCTMRSEADTSAVAVGVAAYDTYQAPGWEVFSGTSISSPLIAGVFALKKNAATLNYAQQLWQAGGTAKLWDITSGPANGTCPSQYTYICTPGVGYDGITGWGTPHGTKAF
jgi:hypothetical protein